MRTVEELVDEWVTEFGLLGRGKNGPFRYIDYGQKKDLLIILVRTLIDEGFDEQTLKSTKTANIIINACEAPDGASSRSASKIRKSKQITSNNLKFVLREFFRGSFSTHSPPQQNNEQVPLPQTVFEQPVKQEKPLDIEPKNRIVADTTGIVDNPLDLEFLKELGVDPSFVTGKSDE